MGKLILVSNRLAVSAQKKKGGFTFIPSMGGLATGLSSLEGNESTIWIGWCGLPAEQLDESEIVQINRILQEEHSSLPVYLSSQQLKTFYYGFCNGVIWPLFHYFPSYAVYDNSLWEAYESVNALYLQRVLERAEPEDTIWVHDYQLMLLPGMIRQVLPDSRIGFFLHIPFPSFEIFRLLPWREQVREMGEALLINPNSVEGIAEALKTALELPQEEQRENNAIMNERLRRYDIRAWSRDFLEKLDQVRRAQEKYLVKKTSDQGLEATRREYQGATRRLFLFDYDGTLVPLADRPGKAAPDQELAALLRELAADEANAVVVAGGRSRPAMDDCLKRELHICGCGGNPGKAMGTWAACSGMTAGPKGQYK